MQDPIKNKLVLYEKIKGLILHMIIIMVNITIP
jgi:hypothetical protein